VFKELKWIRGMDFDLNILLKVKLFLYRPAKALGVPGG
jgi:hypothetical protein